MIEIIKQDLDVNTLVKKCPSCNCVLIFTEDDYYIFSTSKQIQCPLCSECIPIDDEL